MFITYLEVEIKIINIFAKILVFCEDQKKVLKIKVIHRFIVWKQKGISFTTLSLDGSYF